MYGKEKSKLKKYDKKIKNWTKWVKQVQIEVKPISFESWKRVKKGKKLRIKNTKKVKKIENNQMVKKKQNMGIIKNSIKVKPKNHKLKFYMSKIMKKMKIRNNVSK